MTERDDDYSPEAIDRTNEEDEDFKPWRVGANYGVHVYERDESQPKDRPVATFFRPEDAQAAVEAYNRRG